MPSRDRLIDDFAQRMAGKSYDLAIDLRLYDETKNWSAKSMRATVPALTGTTTSPGCRSA